MSPNSLLRRVRHYIVENKLVLSGQTIVIGISGGPDSACLAHLLVQMRDSLGIVLHGAHLNHGLRGEAADADAEYVAKLLSDLAVPATIGKEDVAAYQHRHRLSLDEAARQVRYAFLAQVAQQVGAAAVAVGHTADDQAETILLHLVRGSGLAGLVGMRPKTELGLGPTPSPVTVIRPLLSVRRSETTAYCQAQGLAPRQDASNQWLEPRRNWLRHQVMPLLEAINPAVGLALGRAATLVADDLAFLESEASRLFSEVAQATAERVAFERATLLGMPSVLRRYLLRRGIQHLWGDLAGLESSHLLAMEKALLSGAGRQVHLPRGLVFAVEHHTATLAAAEATLALGEGEYSLDVPGVPLIPGWKVTAELEPARPEDRTWQGFSASLDAAACGQPLVVRQRRPGDRFHPLGLPQPKKLQDFLVDAHVPRRLRDALPLVVSPSGIVWVVSHRIAEWAKLTPNTRQVLCLDFVFRGKRLHGQLQRNAFKEFVKGRAGRMTDGVQLGPVFTGRSDSPATVAVLQALA